MTRNELLHLLPKHSRGAELGVFKADFSKVILEIVEPEILYLIDLWEGIGRSGDKDAKNIETVNLSEWYEENILEMQHPAVRILKGNTNLLRLLPDDSLDFVYIDAEHTYNGVKNDLRNSLMKVKKGGWIMGHDYAKRTEGVIKAVDEFCKTNGLQINFLTDDGCPSYAIQLK